MDTLLINYYYYYYYCLLLFADRIAFDNDSAGITSLGGMGLAWHSGKLWEIEADKTAFLSARQEFPP